MRSHFKYISLIASFGLVLMLGACKKNQQADPQQPASATHSVIFSGKGLAPSIIWLDSTGKLHIVPFKHGCTVQLGANPGFIHPANVQNQKAQSKAADKPKHSMMRHSMLWSGKAPITLAFDPQPAPPPGGGGGGGGGGAAAMDTLHQDLYVSSTNDTTPFYTIPNDTTPFKFTITDTAVYVYNPGAGATVSYMTSAPAGNKLHLEGPMPGNLTAAGPLPLSPTGLNTISCLQLPSTVLHWMSDDVSRVMPVNPPPYHFTYGLPGITLGYSLQ
jgi:hypothetical protein